MDIDQLQKTVEWLDEERRNDKRTISDLQKKIAKLEGMVDQSSDRVKEVDSEVTRLGVVVAKVGEFDDSLVAHRTEVKKEMEDREKRLKRREQEAKRNQKLEMENLTKTISALRSDVEAIQKMRAEMRDRAESEMRMNRLLTEMQDKLAEFGTKESDRDQDIRSLEDERRQDNKKFVDLQGEVSALRKRTDEHRGKLEVVTETYKKADTRLAEVVAAESQRREEQSNFMEKITVAQSDRERAWKEWAEGFEKFDRLSSELQEYLNSIGETERAVKQAQEAFEEISEQMGRRINEITEMQRLGEERFRQEWSTFKADDQKRWTNYTLTQEEQQRELGRQLEKLTDQFTNHEDNLQEIQDIVQFLSEQSEKRMQALLNSLRDWVSESERFLSSVR